MFVSFNGATTVVSGEGIAPNTFHLVPRHRLHAEIHEHIGRQVMFTTLVILIVCFPKKFFEYACFGFI